MSIFSKVKKAKQAADEHKQASSQAQRETPKPAPYKHVPKHAAQDAMISAPTSWSVEESRAKVAEYNKRKSVAGKIPSDVLSLRSMGSNLSRTGSEISFQSMQSTKSRASTRSSPYSYNGSVPPVPTIPSRFSSGSFQDIYKSSSRTSMYTAMRRQHQEPLYESSTEEEEEGEASSTHSRSSADSEPLEMKPYKADSPSKSPLQSEIGKDDIELCKAESSSKAKAQVSYAVAHRIRHRSLYGGRSNPSLRPIASIQA